MMDAPHGGARVVIAVDRIKEVNRECPSRRGSSCNSASSSKFFHDFKNDAANTKSCSPLQ